MRFSNRLARLIQDRKPAVGLWINLSDPAVAEIAGIAGFDWVMIDTEHNPLSELQVQTLLYACSSFDMTTVVRARTNAKDAVTWLLDAGAGGVIIPSLRDAEDARCAVAIAKYHPLGQRGFGPNHATAFGSRGAEYLRSANHDVVLIGQVELASAVEEIEEIVRLEGLDGIWIGPADLAQSIGRIGQSDHPDVQAAIDRVIDAANRWNKPWGIPTASLEDLDRYIRRSGLIMTIGSDTRVLRGQFETLANAAMTISHNRLETR